MAPALTAKTFGILPGGIPIEAWTLCGPGALVAEIITYGATLTRLLAPDRHGCVADVVLGFSNLESYCLNPGYIGATVGRVAGRLTGARFRLDGRQYELARNDGPNHLHGGVEGFNKKVWTAFPVTREGGNPSLRLSYTSPDGEEGYPGTVQVSVTYTITEDEVFLIETEAVTDKPTPLNLTHHSYFNLAGESAGSIEEHELQIHAKLFAVTDECMTLLGREEPVAGRGNDFRSPRKLAVAIPGLFQNHGDLYRLRVDTDHSSLAELSPAARLEHQESGRVLAVSTTATHLQLYTGAALDGSLIGKSGARYGRHAGLCLECEGYPDGANTPELGNIILRPGQTQREVTAYAFRSLGPSKTAAGEKTNLKP